MPRYEPWNTERASTIIAAHKDQDGAALPIFHDLQDVFGFVPEEAIPMVAEALNLSRAEMYGTVTFYHDFRKEPPGRRVLKLCRAESCQAAGGEALAARAEDKLGVKFGETTADYRVTLEPVYCLGLCHSSPAALLDHHRVVQANVVTTEYSDWATNCPEYKVTAVQVMPSNGPSEWQEEYQELSKQARRITLVAAE